MRSSVGLATTVCVLSAATMIAVVWSASTYLYQQEAFLPDIGAELLAVGMSGGLFVLCGSIFMWFARRQSARS